MASPNRRRPPNSPPIGAYRGVAEELPLDFVDVPDDQDGTGQEQAGQEQAGAGSAGALALPIRVGEGTVQPVDLAVRFDTPEHAARCLGLLLDVVAAHPQVRRDETSWWVLALVPLDLGRELVELTDGRGYVRAGDHLLPDPGWGPVPSRTVTGPAVGPVAGPVAVSALVELPVLDLVVAAGLHRRPAQRLGGAVVLAPTRRAKALLQRALDLRITATFRPVRVWPQPTTDVPPQPTTPLPPGLPAAAVPAAGPVAQEGTLVEVRLDGTTDRPHLPVALVSALDADPAAVVCREVSSRLLIQHDRFSPLTDRQLDRLLPEGTWILADRPHGCWAFEPLAEAAPAWQLTTLHPSHRLDPGRPGWADPAGAGALPEPEPLTVVASSRADGPVDAVLVRASELRAVRLLLEGHPLAESAMIVPGRDHALLTSAGGIIDRVPVGTYLTRVGPGPVYVAHGWRTEPVLPAAAWRSLFADLPDRALVLEPDRTLVFDLSARCPVWELWAGDPPPVDHQVPADVVRMLAELDTASTPPEAAPTSPYPARPTPASTSTSTPAPAPAPAPTPERRLRGVRRLLHRLTEGRADGDPAAEPRARERALTWQERALAAELDGDLVAAARLCEHNGEPFRAARLYERAALERDGEGMIG